MFWLIPVFVFFTYDQDAINDFIKDCRDDVREDWGWLPFIAVIFGVTFIKALNGPALSKSFITVSLTILIYELCGPDTSKQTVMILVVVSDCIFNLVISLTQLLFSAPRMSGTLFFYCALYIDFVSTFHWIIFIMGFIFLATREFAPKDSRFIGYAFCLPLAFWSLWNMFQKCVCLQREKTIEFDGSQKLGLECCEWDLAQISMVEKNSLAHRKGIKSGWRIVKFRGKDDTEDKEFDPSLKLVKAFDLTAAANIDMDSESTVDVAGDFNLNASSATPSLRPNQPSILISEWGLQVNQETRIIEAVAPNSRAAKSKIKPGWKVISIDGVPATSQAIEEVVDGRSTSDLVLEKNHLAELEDRGQKYSLTFRWHRLSCCCPGGKHTWKKNTLWWYEHFILVPWDITLKKLSVFARWCELFEYYQANEFTVFHGILRLVMVMKDPEKYESKSIREIWNEVDNCSFILYGVIPGLLWAYTAEFVLVMDTILLVMYHWSNAWGICAILFNTLCDFDRWYYVSNAYDWVDGRKEFDVLFEDVVWYTVLKTILSFAMGWLHYLAIHYYYEAFAGPAHKQDTIPRPSARLPIQRMESTFRDNTMVISPHPSDIGNVEDFDETSLECVALE